MKDYKLSGKENKFHLLKSVVNLVTFVKKPQQKGLQYIKCLH